MDWGPQSLKPCVLPTCLSPGVGFQHRFPVPWCPGLFFPILALGLLPPETGSGTCALGYVRERGGSHPRPIPVHSEGY